MDPAVVAALVTAIAGAVGAALSLFFSRRATEVAARAQESSKQSEQLRVKATEYGERLLAALGELLIGAEAVENLLALQPDLDPYQEPMLSGVRRLGKGAAEAHRLLYLGAIHISPEIQTSTDELLATIWGPTDALLRDPTGFVERLREDAALSH